MSRSHNKLTALQVNRLSKPGLHGDGGGLTLQITKGGVKSWLFRYMVDGKAYGMGLGPTNVVGLAEARIKAAEVRKQLHDGHNPLQLKREKLKLALLEKAKAMTFDQCAKAYIDAHKASWKNPKHQDQWTNTLATYASPVFGSLPVAEVDTAWVVKSLQPIWLTKTETASRVRGRIESVLDWATTSGHRAGENPARWKGHLENLLASISKTARVKNHPSLPWAEVGSFMDALKRREGNSARALELLVLTACRSGEVRGMRWPEINFTEKVWTIPAARMKAGREHQVPISEATMSLLIRIKQEQDFLRQGGILNNKLDLVFLGAKGLELSDMSLTAVIRRLNKETERPRWIDSLGLDVTAHGFRSTFRMWAAEATDHPREVAEHALAHQLPDAVERAYQRGTQFTKRVALMKDWSEYCTELIQPAIKII